MKKKKLEEQMSLLKCLNLNKTQIRKRRFPKLLTFTNFLIIMIEERKQNRIIQNVISLSILHKNENLHIPQNNDDMLYL